MIESIITILAMSGSPPSWVETTRRMVTPLCAPLMAALKQGDIKESVVKGKTADGHNFECNGNQSDHNEPHKRANPKTESAKGDNQ